ncbi:CPBP family glutamic-type intramembrane protease [Legionella maioricensis]|uniref:CPBP family glutamic-type intramembrane protease n=1 Tax=Legionella maioricensis TaxID=2896528 RepID=A0A9X2D1P7_9GAMM|nr:CPBP family glutamic-type intramembrane protease [Legionella maioricensis]MCL9684796.1 CPBP family glutamic-type intramembrane protease [Legionella maioricensis]MCL9687802.1 CPBP family glutamic-type intramembrane protease [Legionella maioricensis]
MIINWPLIIVLFGLSIPGIVIAMRRLIYFLLPNNTDELKKRMSRFAILQTLFMVLVMSFAGAVLSSRTGLHDPLLEALLLGKAGLGAFQHILLPTFLYSLLCLLVFLGLYYGVVGSILDDHSFRVMANLRRALGMDGCVLYGGVVEEVIARWGLMNLIAFFAMLFAKQHNEIIIWIAIVLSGLMFGVGQIPAYLAAGCLSTRRLVYSILSLCLWQSLVFGYLFWQYGLLSAIFAHMLFHLGWSFYDNRWK